MEETFKLHHAALYSKCWYKRSGDIWSDLRKTMSCDGYSGDIMDKGDIVSVLLNNLIRIPNKRYSDETSVFWYVFYDDEGDNITCSILSISFISVNGLGLLIILAMYIQSII